MAQVAMMLGELTVLGIDPGVNTGWAELDESGLLVSCGLLSHPIERFNFDDYRRVVIEYPQVYPNTSAKEANDLIKVAIMAGEYAAQFKRSPVLLVKPHEWKGSVLKHIHNDRVLQSLTSVEKTRIPKLPDSKLHNVIDAIGLAKWGYKKLQRTTPDSHT